MRTPLARSLLKIVESPFQDTGPKVFALVSIFPFSWRFVFFSILLSTVSIARIFSTSVWGGHWFLTSVYEIDGAKFAAFYIEFFISLIIFTPHLPENPAVNKPWAGATFKTMTSKKGKTTVFAKDKENISKLNFTVAPKRRRVGHITHVKTSI